jgi:acetyl-CoA carboxylase biotin carboxyl carrier protein
MSSDTQDTNIRFVTELADLLEKKGLSEIEINVEHKDSSKLTVKVSKTTKPISDVQFPLSNSLSQAPQNKNHLEHEVLTSGFAGDDPRDHPGIVSSPMVGTIYISPEPGVEPFIKIGDNVKIGETLFIIEAMKTMNQIPSPKTGKIVRILIDDGVPVEFDTPLVVIE